MSRPSPFRARRVAGRIVSFAFALAAILSVSPPALAQSGLAFDGVNDHVTFGPAPSLGLPNFTLELWFRREGPGVTTSTGSGGVTAVPLLTKGRAESDGSVLDMNWFLGIRGTDSLLVGDFEEGTGQPSPGLNHPIVGVTPIRSHVWYHAALTHDGTMWRLWLDGRLEAEIAVGRLPQAASTQHAGLATAFTSTGVAAGFFQGRVDEVRIWDRARTAQELRDSLAVPIALSPGLVARYGLDENAGTAATNSVAGGVSGTLVNGASWVSGSTFTLPQAVLFGGTNGHVTFGAAPALGLSQFTIETWFRRDGAGTTANTGTGGVLAVPLVTKGVGEAEASTVDLNWFLGIRGSDGVLAADFEEGTGQPSPGLNHPVVGATAVTMGAWHHAAATYDGATWRLYLDGVLDATLPVGRLPQAASVQHGALGSALNSTGAASGFLHGRLDETRVWNYARSEAEIVAAINQRIDTPQTGLVARWGFDEAAGTAVPGSAGTTVNGTFAGTNWGWADGAPFDLVVNPTEPPAAPADLVASVLDATRVTLSWTDAATNESAYEIERSLTGPAGPFSPLVLLPANAQGHVDASALPEFEHCYRLRATNAAGSSAWAGPACVTTPAAPNLALDLGGSDAYVTFGSAAGLGLAQFTLETWFRRDGAGVATSTGAGGVTDAIPLVTKGRAETDGGTVDMNWFLGIRAGDGVLVADFEEGTGQPSPGLNHPVTGATPATSGAWHHAAATYDGTTWRLYLDGVLDATLAVGRLPQSASVQHAALGSALTSTGAASGFFDGVLDEVRVWNVALSQAEIRARANLALLSPQPGLVARWGLDETTGTVVGGSAGTTVNGTITGVAWSRASGSPFDLVFDDPPAVAGLVGPPDGATGVPTSPQLEVAVSDPEGQPLTVTFHGRPATNAPGPDFTLIGLPDTQYYTGELNGGSNAIFHAQAQWVVSEIAARRIAFAVQLGDCTEHGQNGGDPIEWLRADSVLVRLEDPATTLLPEGLPYGICVGNHDQTPSGDAAGSTAFYNQFFGESRFLGRTYYGGHHGAVNDNWFALFSASGLDFLVIGLEYDTSPDVPVLDWADSLCKAYPSRRVIVASHSLLGTGNPGAFSAQGQSTYDALKDNPNLTLLLCGHVPGEGRRQDTYQGSTVHTLLSDYQSRTRGGDGWLRLLEFSPSANVIRVRTYSPTLDQFESDADSSSQFTIDVDLSANPAFEVVGTLANVPSGTTASLPWPGRAPAHGYEWMVTVSDGRSTTTGPVWSFTTGSASHALAVTVEGQGTVTKTPDQETYAEGTPVMLAALPDPGWSFAGWSGDVSGAETPIDVLMDGPKTVLATFLPVTGAGDPPVLAFGLGPVGPTPSRGTVRVGFAMPAGAPVRLAVYDVRGREIAVLAEGTFPPGRHAVDWEGRADSGRRVAPGLYFVTFLTPEGRFTRRLVRTD
jgi:hypothetical protein